MTEPIREAETPTAHPSHALNAWGCERCSTFLREFSISLPCLYRSAAPPPPEEPPAPATCSTCHGRNADYCSDAFHVEEPPARRVATCQTCGHDNPHDGPAGDVNDACTHPTCNCAWYAPKSEEPPAPTLAPLPPNDKPCDFGVNKGNPHQPTRSVCATCEQCVARVPLCNYCGRAFQCSRCSDAAVITGLRAALAAAQQRENAAVASNEQALQGWIDTRRQLAAAQEENTRLTQERDEWKDKLVGMLRGTRSLTLEEIIEITGVKPITDLRTLAMPEMADEDVEAFLDAADSSRAQDRAAHEYATLQASAEQAEASLTLARQRYETLETKIRALPCPFKPRMGTDDKGNHRWGCDWCDVWGIELGEPHPANNCLYHVWAASTKVQP